MIRHLVIAVRLLALFCLCAILLIWFRSYFAFDMISYVQDRQTPEHFTRRIWSVRSSHGGVMLEYIRSINPANPQILNTFLADAARRGWNWDRDVPRAYPYRYGPAPYSRGRLHDTAFFFGIEWSAGEEARSWGTADLFMPSLTLPYWLPALPLALFALPWLRRTIIQRRRRQRGCCLHCGYDLRESPDRCPECGTVPRDLRIPSDPGATA